MKISWKFPGCIFLIFFVSLFVTSCQQSEEVSKPSEQKLLDMTYPFNENTIYWPNARPFQLKKGDWRVTEKDYWYASNEYCAAEHGGTHADAPIHFAEGGRTIDQIPLKEWIGPAVKIDVTEKCSGNRDYLLAVEDIQNWEQKHGRIPEHAWVIMYTGIDTKYYPDKEKVLGTPKTGEEAIPELHFPGFSPESVQFLVNERDITGIAIDTPSIDYGQSKEFKVHQILFEADKVALENIAKLDKLPEVGAVLYVMPMMIEKGTGSPARVFAVLP
ncbi:cyclase family protein [bacterium]|nr:cyclase family protein [bacterium]